MKLYTERLTMCELSVTDLENVHRLHSLPETNEFNTLGVPDSIQTTEYLLEEWIKLQTTTPRTTYVFCIKLKETEQFVGLIALNLGKLNYRIAEVWYKLDPAYWRLGYTTEALLVLLKYGFTNLSLHRIEAGCAVKNIASLKVLEKVGMVREGLKRKILPIRGEWVDTYFYSILETEFVSRIEQPH